MTGGSFSGSEAVAPGGAIPQQVTASVLNPLAGGQRLGQVVSSYHLRSPISKSSLLTQRVVFLKVRKSLASGEQLAVSVPA